MSSPSSSSTRTLERGSKKTNNEIELNSPGRTAATSALLFFQPSYLPKWRRVERKQSKSDTVSCLESNTLLTARWANAFFVCSFLVCAVSSFFPPPIFDSLVSQLCSNEPRNETLPPDAPQLKSRLLSPLVIIIIIILLDYRAYYYVIHVCRL